jgi:hypothetical protein
MRGVWKRSQGRATKAPPDERGGNRHARPNAIPRHTSTLPTRAVGFAQIPLKKAVKYSL